MLLNDRNEWSAWCDENRIARDSDAAKAVEAFIEWRERNAQSARAKYRMFA